MNLFDRLTLFARTRCYFMGHMRGKRIFYVHDAPAGHVVTNLGQRVNVGEAQFQCPRCLATWTRPARKAKA